MTQERKDQLYNEMLKWICEHVKGDEDLYITLHEHFEMTKEELHEVSIYELDQFFSEESVAEKRARLFQKIDKEYSEFLDDVRNYDPDSIITSAEYISAMKRVYEYIHKEYIIKGDQIDYFLKLKKPLDAISDWYSVNDVDAIDDLNQAIWQIVDQRLYMDDEQSDGIEMS